MKHDEVPISEIRVGERQRPLNFKWVEELSQSIKEHGLFQPIVLDAEKRLLAGRHRLEAFKLLKRSTIPAVIKDVTGLKAEMVEIDENLMRQELTKIERIQALVRRKEIYEILHPETRVGAAGGQANSSIRNQVQTPDRGVVVSDDQRDGTPERQDAVDRSRRSGFVRATARATGRGASSVFEEVMIGTRLAPDVASQIPGTPIEDKKGELIALARQTPERQREIIQQIADGEAEKATECLTPEELHRYKKYRGEARFNSRKPASGAAIAPVDVEAPNSNGRAMPKDRTVTLPSDTRATAKLLRRYFQKDDLLDIAFEVLGWEPDSVFRAVAKRYSRASAAAAFRVCIEDDKGEHVNAN